MNIGYCTNIHSGARFDQTLENLKSFSKRVKQTVSDHEPMGVGLWFSEQAVSEALQPRAFTQLQEFLTEAELTPYTFNGFPQFDFHQPVVKKNVYLPDWTCSERLNYTLNIAKLQSQLLPPGSVGTISTLPLGWTHPDRAEFFKSCASMLKECASGLDAIFQNSGVKIRLCLEPEPGCALQMSSDVCEFFQKNLFDGSGKESLYQDYLGVCHDICHAAVMMESQAEVLESYRGVGLNIGKVQISSAPQFTRISGSPLPKALARFVEPRYMHQTKIRSSTGVAFFADLPDALAQEYDQKNDSTWRIHFHVPIMLEAIEDLQTTQCEIIDCLDWFVEQEYPSHFEVETYAWEVSPDSVRGKGVVDSIVAELDWLKQRFPKLVNLNHV